MIKYIRTFAPIIASFVISLLLDLGIDLTDKPTITLTIGALIAMVWYVAATWLEKKSPAFGKWMLGSAQKPSYDDDREDA